MPDASGLPPSGSASAMRPTFALRLAVGIGAPLLAAAGLAFAFAVDPEDAPILQCPTYRFLGVYCPGCGTTRLLHALLHLRVAEAFGRNPLIFLLLPFLAYVVAAAWLRFVAARPVLPVPDVPRWLGWPLFALLVAFTVLRNLPYAPFAFLAP